MDNNVALALAAAGQIASGRERTAEENAVRQAIKAVGSVGCFTVAGADVVELTAGVTLRSQEVAASKFPDTEAGAMARAPWRGAMRSATCFGSENALLSFPPLLAAFFEFCALFQAFFFVLRPKLQLHA